MGDGVSCGHTCVRIIFVSFNVLVLLAGIAISIVGGIYRFGSDALKADAEDAFRDIKVDNYAVYDALNGLSLAIFIVGLVMVLISFIGILGSCCKMRWCLVIYAILVFLIIIAEIVPAAIFLIVNGEFEESFKKGMKTNIQKANQGGNDADDLRSSIEYMFTQYKCCHVDQERLNANVIQDANFCKELSNESYDKDCYDKVEDTLSKYAVVLAGIGIAIVVIEILCFVFAICLFRIQRKEMVV